MQDITIIVNGAPYGTEGPYNALRLASALVGGERKANVHLFLMADAVFSAKQGQDVPEGYYNAEKMISGVVKNGASVQLCGTCCRARGLTSEQIVEGASISSMIELANHVIESDKVISF